MKCMNEVILMGRLTRDPEVRYAYSQSQNGEQMAIARYILAVDRRYSRNASGTGQTADFISCVAFGRQGEFAEKYLKKGTKIAISGRIQTGSYTNKEGQKVYTTDVVVEEQEFAESKSRSNSETAAAPEGDFMAIPDELADDLPFK
jgi:single-strand DNA-binding protein